MLRRNHDKSKPIPNSFLRRHVLVMSMLMFWSQHYSSHILHANAKTSSCNDGSTKHLDNDVISNNYFYSGGMPFVIFAGAFSLPFPSGKHASRTRRSNFLINNAHQLQPCSYRTITPSIAATTDTNDEMDMNHKNDSKRRVIVIGAGVGGLATAARIRSSMSASSLDENASEVEVLVLEKNGRDQLGGRCGSFDVTINDIGTFRHERGPSLLLLKEEYERLFEDCSVGDNDARSADGYNSAAEKFGLVMKQCIPAYQVVFDDGDAVQLGFPSSESSSGAMQASVDKLNSFETNGASKWNEYLNTCAAFLDCGLPNFIEEKLDLASFPNFLWEALRDGGKRWPLQPHSSMLESLFSSPKLCALASFQDLYVGLEPWANSNQIGGGILRKTAPAVFGLLAALELHPNNKRAGVFAPVGGFRQVAESMHQLCLSCGVKFQFDTSVTRVTDEGVFFVSKSSDGGGERKEGFLRADLVICNADLPFATETIVKPQSDNINSYKESKLYVETYDWNDKLDYSSGVIAFHWSISKTCDALNTHNVFMCAKSRNDAINSWGVLRDDCNDGASKSLLNQPFNFYVHRAGKTDETAAPFGCDSIMALVPCPTLTRDRDLATLNKDDAIAGYNQQFDAKVVDDVRKAVLQRLAVLEGLGDLDKLILDEVIDTPATYADYYNVGAGVPFALSHGLGQLSITRPGTESQTHDNVLYVGASSRPGNGVPLVLIGARSVAKKAIQKLNSMAALR